MVHLKVVGLEYTSFSTITAGYKDQLLAKDTIVKKDTLDFYEQVNDEELIRDTLLQIMGIAPENDTKNDPKTLPDTAIMSSKQDSLELKQVLDSLKNKLPATDSDDFKTDDSITINDTIYIRDTIVVKDTIFVKDTVVLTDTLSFADTMNLADSLILQEKTYDEMLNHWRDSLIFDRPDSTYYVMSNIQDLLKIDTHERNDSVEQAIHKLFQYRYSYKQIDSVKDFLQSKLDQDQFYFLSEDTTAYHLNDSIKSSLRYILNSIPQDSMKLIFKNSVDDSILLYTAKEEIDSVHFKIFDNRGEYAVLWIRKSDENAYDLILEEGTYIEKAKQQKIVTREVDTDEIRVGLKKARKVNIIVPIWDIGSTADITFNQGYQSNWVEGGENSLSALSVLRFNADYSYGKQRTWDTDIEYKLGYLKAGNNPLQKNDDRFEFNSKYGRTAFNNWYYSLLFNFRTQFLKGYDYPNDSVPVSRFLSPGHLVFSLGLDYKPNKNLTVLISPVTSKFTIVSDTASYDQTRFGVGANEKVRKEIGAYVKAIWKYNITKDIHMENKINFFTNYTNNPQNVDIDWEFNLKMRLTRYIKMSLNTHFIYDDDVDIPVYEGGEQVGVTKGLQFREVIGIGFSYYF
jgi:hypothetical protein